MASLALRAAASLLLGLLLAVPARAQDDDQSFEAPSPAAADPGSLSSFEAQDPWQ